MKTTGAETVRTGASPSLEQVFREQAPKLWRSLLLSMGNSDIASDAVAEAFAQALRRGSDLSNPTAWIWRTAFRLASAELKRWRANVPIMDRSYHMDDRLLELTEALKRLTTHQRVSLVLADYAGYPHREIATILGSSVSAVAVHVYRGRRRLRVLLEDEND